MTAKAPTPPKPRISGFCNITLPRTATYDPHQRCAGCDCTAPNCPCNPDPPQEDPVPDDQPLTPEQMDQLPSIDVSGTDRVYVGPLPDDAPGWVAQARAAADGLNVALKDYAPDHWHDAARLLDQLRQVTATLGQLDASLVQWLYLHGEHGLHQLVPGIAGPVHITRGRAKERWAAEEATREYVDRKMAELEGEMPDPSVVVGWVLEVIPATQSTSCRKTPLKAAGIDLEDYYWSEPGTLQVGLPKPSTT